MTLSDAIHNWKIVVGTIGALGVGGLAVGYQFDRPVWASEIESLVILVKKNTLNLMENEISRIQRSIWEQTDRLDKMPSEDGLLRLRELKADQMKLREQRDEWQVQQRAKK